MIFFIFIQILEYTSVSKQWRPDQTPRFVSSDLVLHCLPMSHEKDARLIWDWSRSLSEPIQCEAGPRS